MNHLKLVTSDGFCQAFWAEMKNHSTQVAAYEFIESEYVKYFGQRRYSDYNSFRQIRDRKLKKTHKCNKVT